MTPNELRNLPAPTFWCRVSCNLYEQLVLLGVLALTFLLPNLFLGIVLGIALPSWLTFFYLYSVLACYFVWYWTKSGQTLAMQTWRIRLITTSGQQPQKIQAFRRYVYGSCWLIPCVIIQYFFDFHRWHIIELLFTVALFLWPLTIYLDKKNRQSLPDRLSGTQLIQIPKNIR